MHPISRLVQVPSYMITVDTTTFYVQLVYTRTCSNEFRAASVRTPYRQSLEPSLIALSKSKN